MTYGWLQACPDDRPVERDDKGDKMMSKKPTVLMILDGYGLNDRKDGNAIAEAATPVMDQLMK